MLTSEGLNGRLPNQDLINSFRLIAEHTGGVPVVLYDHLDPQQVKNHNVGLSRVLQWLPRIIRSQPEVVEYATRARNIARQMKHQALGKGSGVHGLFHRCVPLSLHR
jgi:glycosylphosphatidylinositol transamidase